MYRFFLLEGLPHFSHRPSLQAAEVEATPMQVALAWLLRRSQNILLIPGTSSLDHLRQNIDAASLTLSSEMIARLDVIGEASALTSRRVQ
jgi:pyridoxine 4-dehydrogenase